MIDWSAVVDGVEDVMGCLEGAAQEPMEMVGDEEAADGLALRGKEEGGGPYIRV